MNDRIMILLIILYLLFYIILVIKPLAKLVWKSI
jgi:hypothetical protein